MPYPETPHGPNSFNVTPLGQTDPRLLSPYVEAPSAPIVPKQADHRVFTHHKRVTVTGPTGYDYLLSQEATYVTFDMEMPDLNTEELEKLRDALRQEPQPPSDDSLANEQPDVEEQPVPSPEFCAAAKESEQLNLTDTTLLARVLEGLRNFGSETKHLPVLAKSREQLVDNIINNRTERTGATSEQIAARSDFSTIKHPEGTDPLAQHEQYASIIGDEEIRGFLGDSDWRFMLTDEARKKLYTYPKTTFFKDLPYYNPLRDSLRAPLHYTHRDPLTDSLGHKKLDEPQAYNQLVIHRGRDPISGEEVVDPLATDFAAVQAAYEKAQRHTYSTKGEDGEGELVGSSAMVVKALKIPQSEAGKGVVDLTEVRSSDEENDDNVQQVVQSGALALRPKGPQEGRGSTFRVILGGGQPTETVTGRVVDKGEQGAPLKALNLQTVGAPPIPDISSPGIYETRRGDKRIWVSPNPEPREEKAQTPQSSEAIHPSGPKELTPQAQRRAIGWLLKRAVLSGTSGAQEEHPKPPAASIPPEPAQETKPRSAAAETVDLIVTIGSGVYSAIRAWRNRGGRE